MKYPTLLKWAWYNFVLGVALKGFEMGLKKREFGKEKSEVVVKRKFEISTILR